MQDELFETEKAPPKNTKNAKNTKNTPKKSFEEHVHALERAIDRLNDPNLSLKDGMDLYKTAMQELLLAQKLLENAYSEYEKLQTPDKKA
ncbi:exodeoxyribonuclease VII small subunit [Helicobacter pylori]|uniref:Exodeoxyribonuclease 7 small subunit n=1 Tax=Helicobacter pylori Hp H-24 TaxID=992039 RepID=J0KQ78_HELPX|nr:exodeoxyribonuclease VII small subunit [Helicobacter pylori]EJB52845.1 putative exodeoxyribonuclease VII small subunit [Helicobacter pylori Hp H-24]EJC15761.1 exonuclease VII small subunit [Helicobacter pylori Hp H-24b]EJC17157.1 exonuclease VII small subunit [Helicobacter pylori Hp H-24c]EJC40100.1 putative exodeoxyribonuclease VII small subunit [Helicobacter pylori Hp M2]EJC40222.1 putative exodeoxyribonuclease VII small subunit [Helicobacter pylori Hp M1]